MLSEREIAALRNSDFELHCIRMRLVQQSEPPRELEGAGTIRSRNDGQLEFVLLAPGLTDFERQSPRPIGEVIPDSDYFVLEATDTGGRVWRAANLLPDVTASPPGGGYVATGLIGVLSGAFEHRTRQQRRHSIIQYLFADLKLPYNAKTKVRTTLSELESFSTALNAVDISTRSARIVIRPGDDALVMSATALDAHLPYRFDVRLIEALQFMLAVEVAPALVRIIDDQSEVIHILARTSRSSRSSGLPPTGTMLLADLNIPWRLFAAYLEYVARDPSEHTSSLSRQWAPIIASFDASLETQALTRATAVESLCELAVDSGDSESIAPVTEQTRHWSDLIRETLRQAGCPVELRRRYDGMLGSMQQVRAIDKLHLLASKGRIDSQLILAWKRLRNLVAHGVHSSEASPMELISLNDAVLQLLHELIFHIIGYEGPYAMYGRRNWPFGVYPPSSDGAPHA